MAEGHALLLPFDVDDPEFVRGFECGHVWTMLRETEWAGEHSFTMHASNAEMAIRLGEALDLVARSEELGDGWIEVTFSDAGPKVDE